MRKPLLLPFWIPALLAVIGASPSIRSSETQDTSDDAQTPQDEEKVSWLFVQTATSGSFDGKTLTLRHVPPALMFSDRPHHTAGHMRSAELVGAWDKGPDSFAEDPPNAVLSTFVDGAAPSLATVVLSEPRLEKDVLSYSVEILEGDVPTSFGGASLFIDNWGWGHGGYGFGEFQRYNNPAYVPAPPPKFNKDDGYLSFYRHQADTRQHSAPAQQKKAAQHDQGAQQDQRPQHERSGQRKKAAQHEQAAQHDQGERKLKSSHPKAQKSKEMTAKFRELKDLHDGGLITDEDFEKSKAKLLEELSAKKP